MATESKKPKILLFGPTPPSVGGITTFMTLLAQSNLRHKYQFLFFDPSKAAPKGTALASKIVYKILSLFRYALLLFTEKPRTVHLNSPAHSGFWITSAFLVISKLMARKVLLHIHRGDFHIFYESNGFGGRLLIRRIFGLANTIIILSDRWTDFYSSLTGRPNIEVVPNGIIPEAFERLGNPRTTYPWGAKRPVLFMGSLCKDKGIYDLIKAVQTVSNMGTDLVLLLAGEPESEMESRELAALCREKVDRNIIFTLGTVSGEQKIDLLLSAEIFILPSYSEGLPFSLLEAMAAGLSLVVTDVGSMPDIVTDGWNGFVIKPGDYLAMAEKIRLILTDDKLPARFRKNNKERIRQTYNLIDTADKLDRIYSRAAS